MSRLSVLFAVLLVLSGLSLVASQYRARQLFIDLDRARGQARKLDIEWRTLQLDQTNYAKHSLIETAAERDLKMIRPTPRRIEPLQVTQPSTARPELNLAPKLDVARDAP